jgi:hypothetical protein
MTDLLSHLYGRELRIIIIIAIISIGLAASIMGVTDRVGAQAPEETWTVPINLSNSGGTTAPAIVVDINGATHVVWQDAYRGTIYSGFDGTQWNSPVALFFPFSSPVSLVQPGEQAPTGFVPTLVADPSGLVHAFWTDEQDQLFHSFVPAANFGDPGAWSGAAQLAESAVDFDAIVDSQGQLHLAYVRNLETADFPAGIYYRVTNDSGLSWSLPTLLYESPYFRSLTNAEANVDLAVDPAGETLFFSWDNRPRKQVYFTQSTDGGISWGQSQLIDSPTEDNPASSPLSIQAAGYNDDVLLFWQDGDPAIDCAQYFQISSDGGNTWGERQGILEEISGCPQDIHFFTQGDLLVMMAIIQGQVYLLAWDGSQWSNPQPQRELSGFEDPSTYDQVIFDCRQPAQDSTGNLIVVGCDTGGGGDIWETQRSIGDTSEWFPPPSSWTEPEQVTTADTPISNPILLSDSQGRLHAFWVQQETTTTTGISSAARDAIYYSRKENEQWTRPVAVWQSPNGMTRQPAAAIDTNDNLYVVWSGGEGGEIYFSRASGARANSPTEWVEPFMVPAIRQAGSSPDIQVDADGTIHVVYGIPLNENRGIYVTQSSDGGLTWSEPILAFDAVQEGWEMVDMSRLTVSGGSVYNLVFGNYSLPGGSGSKGIYASRSTDGGVNWSEPETITERAVSWSDLIHAPNGALHRVWAEKGSFGTIFQHEMSTDFGDNWDIPISISTIGTLQGDPAITSDPPGQLYLFQAIEDSSQRLSLMNWLWDGSRWAVQENLELGSSTKLAVQSISAAVSSEGRLSVIYVGTGEDLATGAPVYWIFTTGRDMVLPDMLPVASPEPVFELTETPVVEDTILPSPTPTIMLPTLQPDDQGGSQATQSNTWFGLIIAGVLGVLIVGVVFVIRLLGLRK